MTRIRTAVFPVAGRGTRFLPATKASPKEMLPIVDKPLIQYAAEEALAAGADKLVFITGYAKRAIEDHFDTDHELEKELEAQGKQDLLDAVRGIVPSYASCIYIRQPAPLGLGHAVLCSRPAVGDEPFFVHLADDLIDADEPCLKQMATRLREHQCERARRARRWTAKRDRQVRHRRVRAHRRAPVARQAHRREAEARRTRRRTSPWSGRYLLTPAHLRQARDHRPGRGRRDPAHRRHRRAAGRGGRATPTRSRASATTAARSSATSRRPSSSASSTANSATASRVTSRGSSPTRLRR